MTDSIVIFLCPACGMTYEPPEGVEVTAATCDGGGRHRPARMDPVEASELES